jgi:hypothetical protein
MKKLNVLFKKSFFSRVLNVHGFISCPLYVGRRGSNRFKGLCSVQVPGHLLNGFYGRK